MAEQAMPTLQKGIPWRHGPTWQIVGLVGLVGASATRVPAGMRRGPIFTGVLNVLVAILLFSNVRKDTLDLRWFGYAALAAGVLVCGYSLVLYKARQVTPEVVATVPSSANVATDPAPASAEAPRPPAPLSPDPAAAEL